MLYSIIPAEVVFQGSGYLEEVKFFHADYRGERIMIAQMSDKHYEVVRLLSTRPESFLNPTFLPGSIIDEKELRILG